MKEIKVYGEGYFVDVEGNVYGKKGNVLKPNLDGKGRYLQVSLCHGGCAKVFGVHRLVALTLLPKPTPEKDQVNHIDGVKTNNKLENLEWCTRSENMLHSYHVLGNTKGTACMTGKKGQDHNRSKGVIVMSPKGDVLTFGSCLEMKRHTGVDNTVPSWLLSKGREFPYELVRGKSKGWVILNYPVILN